LFEPAPTGVLRQANGFGQLALRLRSIALEGAEDRTVNLI
jgi:hypothetical protein